jgi:hypothetical protein
VATINIDVEVTADGLSIDAENLAKIVAAFDPHFASPAAPSDLTVEVAT